MSEQQFLPGSDDAAPNPAGGQRRAVVFGGVALVVVALGAGAFLLLSGSDDAATSASALPSRPAAVVGTSPSISPSAALPTATEATLHDPFKPLYPPKPTPVPTPTALPTTAPTPGAGLPTTPGGVVGPGGTTGTPGTQNVVKLLSITGSTIPTVTITVDGATYTGKTGEVLGSIAQIMSIRPDDGAATFQLGDATFDLHIGQSYTN